MPFIFLLGFLLAPAMKVSMPHYLSSLTTKAHHLCLQHLSLSDKVREAQAALLCGENIQDENLKNLLTRTSLIHLFVVSGSHLLILESLLLFCRAPLLLRLLFFAFYTLMCSLQAPLLRAFLALLLRVGTRWRDRHWPNDLLILMAGVLCLLLCPEWASSRSLVMSWLAALALCFASLAHKNNPDGSPLGKFLLPSFTVYLLMLPTLWGFGNLHPLGILFNVLLAPLVVFLLMPLAFLSALCSGADPWLLKSLNFFAWLSLHFSEPVQIEKTTLLEMSLLWIFIFSLHGVFHFWRLSLARRRS